MRIEFNGPKGCGKTIVVEALIRALYNFNVDVVSKDEHVLEFELTESQKKGIMEHGFGN